MGTLKRDIRRRLTVSGVGVALLAGLVIAPAVRAATPYSVGDVFAGVGNGHVMQFSPTGTPLNTLTGLPTGENTGMAFDSAGNLYATGFSGNISKYDNAGNFLGSFGSGFTGNPESIVRDAAGNFYVGQAAFGVGVVLKFDPSGAPLGSFSVAAEDRGSDWVDLAADQCTLFYTSEGVLIKRFNVCTNTQLADFATLPLGKAYALRIRPNGEVLVAATGQVYRLDSTGAVVKTYTIPSTSLLFALNLDPDGTSFWTADIFTGNIFRVDIATGAVLTTFNAPPNPTVAGLAVFGEITAATAGISLTPADATNPAGTDHTVTAHVTSGGAPLAGQLVTFSVTGQNAGATGTCVPASCITDASGNVTFTYHDTNGAGDDTITASFTDAGGPHSATAKKHWTAPTDPPITAAGVAVAATEGTAFSGTVAKFTDPDTAALASEYGVTIDWGDGTSSTVATISGSGGSYTVSGGHTYAEEGSYTVTVAITDTDNAANTATVTSTATVADAALTSACAMPSLTTQTFSGKTATFTDASLTGTLSDFSASINWGDSSTSAGTISGGPGTTPYSVSGSHTYGSTGTFTVTTTITDVGGSTSTATCSNGLVFAFAPGGGAFAIGDKESKIGASVNFWGAQWAKNNPVSSGTVVSAFKGFVKTPATPTCASTTWSADPGNSTPPPAGSLPVYMGVIVTGRYSQSGSLISGNIVHIVIVNTTNSGYDPFAPAPGHPGTGKVVATVC